MLASRYYHGCTSFSSACSQRLTGIARSAVLADRWQRYLDSPVNRTRALVEKAAFKLLHY